jgi:hypothetical protein
MMDYTGVSVYPLNEGSDKRKMETGKAESTSPFTNRTGTASTTPASNSPFQIYQPAQQDYSTFQFREPLAPPRLNTPQSPQQQITALGLLPANLTQMMNANMDKLAGQIMSFFKGNRKEKPDEEEHLKRQLNDAFGSGLLGEVLKVEEATKGQMEDGGDS